MPMHQAPSITDEEVEERLPLAGERGRLWRAGTAKFFLDGVLDSGPRGSSTPAPAAPTRTRSGPTSAATRHWSAASRAAASARSRTRSATARCAARSTSTPPPGRRARGMHRVEHIETLLDEDLPRFAAQRVAASMQPLHMEGLDDPATPSSWVDGLSRGPLRARLPRRRPRPRGRADPARLGLVRRRLRPARRASRGRNCGASRAAPTSSPTCPRRRSTPRPRCAATRPPPRGRGRRGRVRRLRPGLRADVTVLGGDPSRSRRTSCRTSPCGARWSTATSCSPADPGKSPAAAPLRP